MLIEGDQGALPLDPTKGSSTLWTPIRAIQLVTLPCYARVFIRERKKKQQYPKTMQVGTEGVEGAIADFVCFHAPSSLPQERTPCVCLFLRHQKQKWACHFAQNAI